MVLVDAAFSCDRDQGLAAPLLDLSGDALEQGSHLHASDRGYLAGRGIILDVVRRTAEQVFMPLTVGGGIKVLDDIRNLLLAGADKV
ncbi:MAG: hypothetical protein HGA43_11085, partial [Nitrospirae bacterium]|nr:hypothetical protein [Nitrospirota bacterium]